jgi:phage-related tail fiber protein
MAIVRGSFASGLQTFLAGSAALPIANGGTGATSASAARTALGITNADPVPAGAVVAMATSTVPSGWLSCEGQDVSRTTYAALFSAISTTFGAGNGSTTFNLPDLRGEFVRGWDNGRGVDAARAFGSAQDDEFEAHTHTETRTIDSGSGAPGGSGGSVQTYSTGSTGGTETRPRNIALRYVIKT